MGLRPQLTPWRQAALLWQEETGHPDGQGPLLHGSPSVPCRGSWSVTVQPCPPLPGTGIPSRGALRQQACRTQATACPCRAVSLLAPGQPDTRMGPCSQQHLQPPQRGGSPLPRGTQIREQTDHGMHLKWDHVEAPFLTSCLRRTQICGCRHLLTRHRSATAAKFKARRTDGRAAPGHQCPQCLPGTSPQALTATTP